MEWVDLSNVECSMWDVGRSGESRVGEEGRSWGAADHLKKKKHVNSCSRPCGPLPWLAMYIGPSCADYSFVHLGVRTRAAACVHSFACLYHALRVCLVA